MAIHLTGHWREVITYSGLTDEHINLLHQNKEMFESKAHQVVMKFYNKIALNPTLASIAENHSTFERLTKSQVGYFINLFSPTIDSEYISYVKLVGAAHARIGLSPDWYLGGVNVYLDEVYKICAEEKDGLKIYHAFTKRILFDTKIAIKQYDRLKENDAFKEKVLRLATNIVEDIDQFIQISKGTGENSKAWIDSQESIKEQFEEITNTTDIETQNKLILKLKEDVIKYHNEHEQQIMNIEELSFIIRDIEAHSDKLLTYTEEM